MKLREFLTEDRWCKGSYARNQDGQEVFYYTSGAEQFSLLGALWHIHDESLDKMKYQDRLASLIRVLHGKRIEEFNDSAEWEDIDRIINTVDF